MAQLRRTVACGERRAARRGRLVDGHNASVLHCCATRYSTPDTQGGRNVSLLRRSRQRIRSRLYCDASVVDLFVLCRRTFFTHLRARRWCSAAAVRGGCPAARAWPSAPPFLLRHISSARARCTTPSAPACTGRPQPVSDGLQRVRSSCWPVCRLVNSVRRRAHATTPDDGASAHHNRRWRPLAARHQRKDGARGGVAVEDGHCTSKERREKKNEGGLASIPSAHLMLLQQQAQRR